MELVTFGLIDYFVFSSLLGVSILIGIYFGFFSKQDTVKEYIYAGKSMSYVPIAISGLSSSLSGITYLGFPTEIYLHGSQYAVEIIGVIIASLITNHVVLPVFFKLQLPTITEYLELRFSKAVYKLCSVMYVFGMITYTAIIIYAPAIAFSQLTGVEIHLLTLIICSICIFYTSLGGVRAVIWTDTFQFVFTIVGFLTILFIGIVKVGGLTNVWNTSNQGGRIIIFDLNPSIYERCTFWTVLMSTVLFCVANLGFSQKYVQKLMTIEKEKDAKKAVWAIFISSTSIRMMCIVVGLVIYTRYYGCDPIKANKIKRLDELLPFFVMDICGSIPGLPGIFLAGIISSSLATLSAALNTLGNMIYNDFIKIWLPESYQEENKAANMMKIITVLVGLLGIALVFVAEKMGTIFEISNSFNGIISGTLLGLFISGILIPWIGKKGVLVGGYTSVVLMSWIVFGTKWYVMNGRIRYENLPTSIETCNTNETLNLEPILPPLRPEDEPWNIFKISILYYPLLGALINIVVALAVSYFTDEMDLSKVNPDHISPLMHKFLPKKEYLKVPLEAITNDQKLLKDNDTKNVTTKEN